MRRLVHPAMLSIGLGLLLSGCAAPPAAPDGGGSPSALVTGTPESADAAPAVQQAWVEDGRLLVAIAADARKSWLAGELPASAAQANAAAPPIIRLARRAAAPGAAAAPVQLQPATAWQALVRRLQAGVTPAEPDSGVVLDVLREDELLLYYDEYRNLRAVPMVFKPPEVRPVRTVALTDLLRDATARLAAELAAGDVATRYVLFDTGDDLEQGVPWVLFDLPHGQVYFARQAAPRTAGPPGGGATLQLLLHTVRSQVTGLWQRPVSTVGRLFTGITTTAVDTLQPHSAWSLQDRPIPPLRGGPGMDLGAWEQELDRVVGPERSAGRLRYLVDGEAFFPALIDAIKRARQRVWLRLYIFDNDDYALKIADLLKRRSREVEVRVLLDGLGTLGGAQAQPGYTPEHFAGGPASIVAYLRRDSAVEVRLLSNPWLQGDHTKLILVDDALAYVGGMNIGREYRYEWHDLMVELRGPVVGALAADWAWAWSRAGVLGEWGTLLQRRQTADLSAGPDDRPLRVLYTRPGDSQILRAQVAAIRRAQRRIYIQNAYFASDDILYELAKARRRGVDVRVILPLRSDFGVMSRNNAVAANLMLENGIRVFVYPGMSHVKSAVYDGWACFGSANFDRLSLRLNRELNLATSDPAAVAELEREVFEPDFARSVELTEPLPLNWADHLMELLADHL